MCITAVNFALDLLQKFEELRSLGESMDAIGATMLEWVSAAAVL